MRNPADNKGTGQSAHTGSLSAFIVCCIDSILVAIPIIPV